MTRHRLPNALTFATLLLLVVSAPVASAEHQRRFDPGHVARLAHQLDDAAYHADRLSRFRSPGYHAVDAAFARLSDAASEFHRVIESGDDPYRAERAFERVAARYYDLRGEFRHFHGPDPVRAAFHRINTPMEDLYRIYTGRDLYRDDPHARRQVQRRSPRYDDDAGRGRRGRGRGRGFGRQ